MLMDYNIKTIEVSLCSSELLSSNDMTFECMWRVVNVCIFLKECVHSVNTQNATGKTWSHHFCLCI